MFNAKKIATVIAAAALMVGVSTSAFAAFADQQLIRVVYERTSGSSEMSTVLGMVKDILAAPGTSSAGYLPTVSNANNLYVAYFAIDRNTNEIWVSGSTDTSKAPVSAGTSGMDTFKSGSTNYFNQANSYTPDANGTVTGSQAAPNSYRGSLSADQGALSNAINSATSINTEASLAALVTGSATSVTQNLYYFANGDLADSKGVAVATITTSAGNSVTTPTPIPAAIYLMGSGLLGLVGLRRRSEA